jgi:hypothetical protein
MIKIKGKPGQHKGYLLTGSHQRKEYRKFEGVCNGKGIALRKTSNQEKLIMTMVGDQNISR